MDAVGEYGGLNLETAKQIGEIGGSYTEFQNGDVVVAKITPCFENGKGALASGLVNGAALGTTELHVLRPLPGLERRFLFYLTISSTYRKTGEAEMYGAGGQKRVPPEFNKDFRIPLPPLPEQRVISDFLDRETEKIDTLVSKKRTLIERLKEKRTALISRTVTRGLPPEAACAAGLDPHPKLKSSGIDWLGDVPVHWEVRPLGRVVRFRGGATPDKAKAEYWDGDIPWVSPKDMKTPRIVDVPDHVSQDALDNSALTVLPIDSVLIVVRGMILAHSFPVAITQAPVTINQDMKALIAGRRLEAGFLMWLLVGVGRVFVSLADESAHGTRKLESEIVEKFSLPIPPLEEQRAIADFVVHEGAKIDGMVAKVEIAIERLQEYRTALITAAVTGKIDVRGETADNRQEHATVP
jgi:type I restriction enzyme S subunit